MSSTTDARVLLRALLEIDCVREMHSAIEDWLRKNPAPPAMSDQLARVDRVLEGWYKAPGGYDPRIVAPLLDVLAAIAERIVRESGGPSNFDARAWIRDWAHEPHPALKGQAPVHVLCTPEGIEQVRQLLEQQQSGAYS